MAGVSKTLRLLPGMNLELELHGQLEHLVWTSAGRCHCCLLYDPSLDQSAAARKARQARAATPALTGGSGGQGYQAALTVRLAAPVAGRRASMQSAATAAARSGIPLDGYELPFQVALHKYSPPEAPRALRLVSRLLKSFTLAWEPPAALGGCAVRQYSIEVANLNAAQHLLDLSSNERLLEWREVWGGSALRATVTDRALFGQVRVRCWNTGCPTPSPYSEPVDLPEFVEVGTRKKAAPPSPATPTAPAASASPAASPPARPRTASGASRPLHRSPSAAGRLTTKCGDLASISATYGIRAAPGESGESGGGGGSGGGSGLRPASSSKNLRKAAARAAGVSAAVKALGPTAVRAAHVLGQFWVEAGVASGERLFGQLVSHAVLAIGDGRAGVGLSRPLAGLASVVLHDAIVPLAQRSVVACEEWEVVVDRCEGFVALARSFESEEAVTYLHLVHCCDPTHPGCSLTHPGCSPMHTGCSPMYPGRDPMHPGCSPMHPMHPMHMHVRSRTYSSCCSSCTRPPSTASRAATSCGT